MDSNTYILLLKQLNWKNMLKPQQNTKDKKYHILTKHTWHNYKFSHHEVKRNVIRRHWYTSFRVLCCLWWPLSTSELLGRLALKSSGFGVTLNSLNVHAFYLCWSVSKIYSLVAEGFVLRLKGWPTHPWVMWEKHVIPEQPGRTWHSL